MLEEEGLVLDKNELPQDEKLQPLELVKEIIGK